MKDQDSLDGCRLNWVDEFTTDEETRIDGHCALEGGGVKLVSESSGHGGKREVLSCGEAKKNVNLFIGCLIDIRVRYSYHNSNCRGEMPNGGTRPTVNGAAC